jgi:hypothetical protein
VSRATSNKRSVLFSLSSEGFRHGYTVGYPSGYSTANIGLRLTAVGRPHWALKRTIRTAINVQHSKEATVIAIIRDGAVEKKRCPKCGGLKALSDFSPDRTHGPAQGGRHCRCKLCKAQMHGRATATKRWLRRYSGERAYSASRANPAGRRSPP